MHCPSSAALVKRFIWTLAVSVAGDVDNKILINGHLVRRVSDDALHFRVTRLRWAMLPSRGSSHFSAAKSEAKSSMYSEYQHCAKKLQ